MIVSYPAVFYKLEDGAYSVAFPDFGVATHGEDLEDATRMAIECLASRIKCLKEYDEEIPKPTLDLNLVEVDEKDGEDDYIEATKQIITVDVEEYARKHFDKSVKKNLTIPKWMNDLALELNINFSKTLQDALLDEINRKRREIAIDEE
ncbi:type II toxin-antitoxin system HicB family antitoxin [Candidatus Arthromitus sp. SFB-rat-Yit]|uniref:type II toxin-antitoxin system HicB family antitoxin n=1 Tax=Candidatus Arthromitus sp. SFB-rat-Yit TaxID=1041504 RepID=UPI000227A305|nr:type II toxin-antitoxin system HicB family antitoxin [Candidatus Arthromitus sp. SFB-rat-Yit]BAK80849.1 hypothetical protein RATSFB_0287 [Candidatus Arthromitus sp. SFB-rat-Yit]